MYVFYNLTSIIWKQKKLFGQMLIEIYGTNLWYIIISMTYKQSVYKVTCLSDWPQMSGSKL